MVDYISKRRSFQVFSGDTRGGNRGTARLYIPITNSIILYYKENRYLWNPKPKT